MATRVVTSIENPEHDHCVDVFVRDDGTFGFEEYRRDPEDEKGWFPLHYYGRQVFATQEHALKQARARVTWMAEEEAR